MKIVANAYWDIGKREVNEDSLFLEQIRILNGEITVAIIADGIGSLEEGECAGGYAVEELAGCLLDSIVPALNHGRGLHNISRILQRKLHQIHEDFAAYSNLKSITLGTTLAFFLIYKKKYLVINLGDSVVIKFKGRREYKLLSQIHANSDGSINKCLGSMGYYEPCVKTGRIFGKTGFLIASDGYYRKLREHMYIFAPKDIWEEVQIQKRLEQAASISKSLKEKDNMSAVYIMCFG